MPHNTYDNVFKIIFGDHTLFAQFLRNFSGIELLKHVQPASIEDLSERFFYQPLRGPLPDAATDDPALFEGGVFWLRPL
jgi:hypothetical protein